MKTHKAKTASFTYCGRRYGGKGIALASCDSFVTCELCLKGMYGVETSESIIARQKNKLPTRFSY